MAGPLSEQKRHEWRERIRIQKESGQSISNWCHEQQIKYESFLYWKKRLSTDDLPLNRNSFQELTDPPTTDAGICIECRGVRITLTKHFDSGIFAQCIQVLKGLTC